jgi:hypothetical protein
MQYWRSGSGSVLGEDAMKERCDRMSYLMRLRELEALRIPTNYRESARLIDMSAFATVSHVFSQCIV